MKESNFDYVVIAILICICIYFFLSKLREREETHYYIDPSPYEICGKEIYVTEFTDNRGLNIRSLFDAIEEICKN